MSALLSRILIFSGEPITVDLSKQQTEENTVDIYNIELTETLELEEDEAAACTEYKNTKYENYGNCVISQIEKTFLPILGCVPPWFFKGSHSKNPICERTLRDYDDRLRDAMEVMDMTSFEVLDQYLTNLELTFACKRTHFKVSRRPI